MKSKKNHAIWIFLFLFFSSNAVFATERANKSGLSEEWKRSLFTFGAGASTFLIANFGLEIPKTCKWCDTTGFDLKLSEGVVWNENRAEAASYSDLITFGVLPAVSGLVMFYDLRNRSDTLLNVFTLINTTLLTYSFTEVIKRGTGRKRPDVSNDSVNQGDDEFLSFPSGHTSMAFALATSTAWLAFKRHYSFSPFVVFFTGLSAIGTGYLRIAAEKHWFTDVASGAALGMFVGSFVPLFTFGQITPLPGAKGLTLSMEW